MYIAILGRQPALGTAELERVFGGKSVTPFSSTAVLVESDNFEIQRFGGVLKAGKVITELPRSDWHQISQKIVHHYTNEWSSFEGKITLGISVYNSPVGEREIQKTGIILKQKLKKYGVSLRLVPNYEPTLSTAASHHNKLGLSANKVELIVVRAADGKVVIAESTGSQNITAYARRDQERPKRDAFVGMLPPKLAQIMINLAVGQLVDSKWYMVDGVKTQSSEANPETTLPTTYQLPPTILDPFCGTGVVLQEAVLMGYKAYGTDLSDKMIDYSEYNLRWLADGYRKDFDFKLAQGDAMTAKWDQPISFVAGETYLGQPFSAPPSPAKLEEVVKNCNHIITEFLKNLRPQIEPGTQICIAIPAWRDKEGHFTHLPLIGTIARFGYKPHEFTNISQNDLLYYRENQVVARELLVLTRD
jgi:tRNA G10  N-methylase Trm11